MARGQKYGGRALGTPNTRTTKAKVALMEVFVGLGDIPEMIAWAKENRGEFYKLWARLVPTEVHGKGFTPPPAKTAKESDADFARRVAYVLNAGVADLKTADLLKDIPETRPN
jgi:hypothetical protein